MKKILSIILLFSSLITLCSCQTDLNGLLNETKEQTTEQTTVQTTVQTTESTQETRPEHVIDRIFIEKDGKLSLQYTNSSGYIIGHTLTNVKKCMFRSTDSQTLTTLYRNNPMGYGSDTYFDFIYVIFEKGYRIPDWQKEIIEKYGIQYGFE